VKLQLYARHLVPHYWIVDPEGRRIEAHTLASHGYELTSTLEGVRPAALAPFPELELDPDRLWP